ncbi:MAG: hypothetical protein IKP73_21275 [Bacteroidales bacterium]|nr:hypothetical protein [Bacteroidales bacterium]
MEENKPTIPTVNDVIDFINTKLVVKKHQYYGKAESEVEYIIAKQLREEYDATNVHRQHSVGGFFGLKCDLDLFDSKCCGIELKLAKQISGNSSAYERLIGQAVYYSKRCYKDNLIVLVVGKDTEYGSSLKEVEGILEELGIHFVYKVVA